MQVKNTGLLRRLFTGTGFTIALLGSAQLGAQDASFYTARELSTLPRYCVNTLAYQAQIPEGRDQAEFERWNSLMGGGMFYHMHHYCWALTKTNRALSSREPQERNHYLANAIQDFDYVIQHASPDFVLLPEILTKKGENQIRLGRGPAAAAVLLRVIELKRDYWPAYIQMSDIFKNSGDLAKAREWLEKGLSAAPDSKTLKQRLADLGGAKGKGTTTPKPSPKPLASERPAEKTAPQPEPEAPTER